MGQKSKFEDLAKQLLNHKNKTPYTDKEIKEIINLLDIVSDVICHNIINKP